jgi:membrane dipeptidase
LIVDLHLDLLLDAALKRATGERNVFRRHHEQALRDGGVAVQVLPMYPDEELHGSPWGRTIAQLDAAALEQKESNGALRMVTSMEELRSAVADGSVAGILALENAEGLEGHPERLVELHRRGLRMVGLTWNHANGFADGVGDDRGRGITAEGWALLERMDDLGIALDLSHLAPRACEEALERFGGVVLASHANAFAENPNPRNLSDDILAEVGARGGVVGLTAIPAFVGAGDYAERLAGHHARIAATAGEGAPAFGADFCSYFEPSADGPLLPQAPSEQDRALARADEPPRDSFYRRVCDAVAERSGPDAVEPLRNGNAMRLLERLLG